MRQRKRPFEELVKRALVIVGSVCFLVTAYFMITNPDVDQLWQKRVEQWKQKETEIKAAKTQMQIDVEKYEFESGLRGISAKRFEVYPYIPSDTHAIFTSIIAIDARPTWLSAVTLFTSLAQTGSVVPNRVLMVIGDMAFLSPIALQTFQNLDVKLISVKTPGHIPGGEWLDVWSRGHAFKFKEYSKVLYIDSTTLVIGNIDHVFNSIFTEPHKPNSPPLVLAALRSYRCISSDKCSERIYPSARFFLLQPDEQLATNLLARISTKSEEIGINDFFHINDDVVSWLPFTEDAYGALVGECDCPDFKYKRTISIGCLDQNKLWTGPMGTFWEETPCAQEFFRLWYQLLTISIPKLSR